METIDYQAAASGFGELLDRLTRTGERVVVTRDGRPMAEITPSTSASSGGVNAGQQLAARRDALAEIDRLRREIPLMSRDEIVDLVREGRER